MECSIFVNKNEHEAVQKKTFTKWINNILKKRTPQKQISDIYTELCDGVVLLEVMEILTKSKLTIERRLHMQRVHSLSNIVTLLKLLNSKFKRKAENINSSDIVDGKPTIILGLLWQIVLNYQIKDEEIFQEAAIHEVNPTRRKSLVGGTPKEALLAWSDKVIGDEYGLKISDFQQSWRDGLAFNAIIHSINPSLVDMNAVARRGSKENFKMAFRVAEEYLDIPQLLDIDDVDVDNPDEKSIMMYLSQFIQKYPHHKYAASTNMLESSTIPIHHCDDKHFSSVLNTMTDSQLKSTYTKLELNSGPSGNKSPKSNVFESKAKFQLKTNPAPASGIHHNIHQIKHGQPINEEDESDNFNKQYKEISDRIQELLGQINENIQNSKELNLRGTIKDQINAFDSVLTDMTEVERYQDQLRELISDSDDSAARLLFTQQTEKLHQNVEQVLNSAQQQQWSIEDKYQDNNPTGELIRHLQVLERAAYFIDHLASLENFEDGFRASFKSSLDRFHQLKHAINSPEAKALFTGTYLEQLKLRVDHISNDTVRLQSFLQYFLALVEIRETQETISEKIERNSNEYADIGDLKEKFAALKAVNDSNTIKQTQKQAKQLQELSSTINNNFLTKQVTKQMIISMATQSALDSFKSLWKQYEEVLRVQKSLLEKWKKLNEKRSKLNQWLDEAFEITHNHSSEDRELFFQARPDEIYNDYKKEKMSFPDVDPMLSGLVEEEFIISTNRWNDLSNQLESIRQMEKIQALKKGFEERILRVEKWLDKSESLVETKIKCKKSDVEENKSILEAAIQQFDTVKQDLQGATKLGESMYKSNMSESEVEEILGRLKINKERFIKSRDNLNLRLKKCKKLEGAMEVYDGNLNDVNAWIDKSDRVLYRLPQLGDQLNVFDRWYEEFAEVFNEKTVKSIRDKVAENKKIIQRIKEKIQQDVDTSLSDSENEEMSEKLNTFLKRASIQSKVVEFRKLYSNLQELLGDIDSNIKLEESQMNNGSDFQKILSQHEEYFGKDSKKKEAQQLINQMKTLSKQIQDKSRELNGKSDDTDDDDEDEYQQLVNGIQQDIDVKTEKVNQLHNTLIHLPQKLADFKEKIAGLNQWIANIEELSNKLEMSGEELEHLDESAAVDADNPEVVAVVPATHSTTPTSQEYKATLCEFQQLTSLQQVKLKAGSELSKLMEEMTVGSLETGVFLEQERKQLEKVIKNCQKIEPRIEKVLNTAPVVAKSIEFKEEVVRRSEKLIELKKNLDNIPEETEVEDMEDLFEQEKKLMASLEQEAPEIMSELEEGRQLQTSESAAKIISSTPVELENTWNIVSGAMKVRLTKLRDKKEAWISVDTKAKTINENVAEEVERLKGFEELLEKAKDLKEVEMVLCKLTEVTLPRIEEKLPDMLDDLTVEVERVKSNLSQQKVIDLNQNKLISQGNAKKCLEQALEMKEKSEKCLKLSNQWNNKLEEFKDIAEKQKKENSELLDSIEQYVEELQLEEIEKMKESIDQLEMKVKEEFQSVIKEFPLNKAQIKTEMIQSYDKQLEGLENHKQKLLDNEKVICQYLDKEKQIQQKLSLEDANVNQLDLEIEAVTPKNLSKSQIKAANSDNILKPTRNKLEQIKKNLRENLMKEISDLPKKNKEVLNDKIQVMLDNVEEKSDSLNHLEEELKKAMELYKTIEENTKSNDEENKNFNEKLKSIDKPNNVEFEDKIKALKVLKQDIEEYQYLIESQNKLLEDSEEYLNDSLTEEFQQKIENGKRKTKEILESVENRLEIEEANFELALKTKDNLINVEETANKIKESAIQDETILNEFQYNLNNCKNLKEKLYEIKARKLDEIMSDINELKKHSNSNLVKDLIQNSKNCQIKLQDISKELEVKLEFIKLIEKLSAGLNDLNERIDETSNKIEHGSLENEGEVQKDLKSISQNLDNLKKLCKSCRSSFPVIEGVNLPQIDLHEVLKDKENCLNELSKDFNTKKKEWMQSSEELKKFKSKLKTITENISKIKVKNQKIILKDLTVSIIASINRDLNELLTELNNCSTEFNKFSKEYFKMENLDHLKDKISEEDMNTVEISINDLNKEIEMKFKTTERMKEDLERIEYLNNQAKVIIDKAKKLLQIPSKFTEQESLRCQLEEVESNFHQYEMDLNGIMSEINDTMSGEISQACKSVGSARDKINQERKIIGDEKFKLVNQLNEELNLLDNLEHRYSQLVKDITRTLDNIQVLSNKIGEDRDFNSAIQLIERELDSHKEIDTKLKKDLSKPFQYFDIQNYSKFQMADVELMMDKSKDLLKSIKEKSDKLTKEKTKLKGELNELDTNLKLLEEKVENYKEKDSRNEVIPLEILESVGKEARRLYESYCDKTHILEKLCQQYSNRDLEGMLKQCQNKTENECARLVEVTEELRKIFQKVIEENLRKTREEHQKWMKEAESRINDVNQDLNYNFSDYVEAKSVGEVYSEPPVKFVAPRPLAASSNTKGGLQDLLKELRERISDNRRNLLQMINPDKSSSEIKKHNIQMAQAIDKNCQESLKCLNDTLKGSQSNSVSSVDQMNVEQAKEVIKVFHDVSNQARNVKKLLQERLDVQETTLAKLRDSIKSAEVKLKSMNNQLSEQEGITWPYLHKLENFENELNGNVEEKQNQLKMIKKQYPQEALLPDEVDELMKELEHCLNKMRERQLSIVEDRKEGQTLLEDWEDQLAQTTEELECLERSIREEMISVDTIEEKEAKLKDSQDHKMQLDQIKTDRLNTLDNLANQLLCSEYRKSFIELFKRIKSGKSTNSKNSQELQKRIGYHRDLLMKFSDLDMNLESVNALLDIDVLVSSGNDINLMKNDVKKLRNCLDKLKESSKDLGRLDKLKGQVLNDTGDYGRGEIKTRYLELRETISKDEDIVGDVIRKIQKKIEMLESIDCNLRQVQEQLRQTKKNEALNKGWNVELSANDQLINDKKNIMTEVEEMLRKLESVGIMMEELNYEDVGRRNKVNELKLDLKSMKSKLEENLNKGLEIQKGLKKIGERMKELKLTQSNLSQEIKAQFNKVNQGLVKIGELKMEMDRVGKLGSELDHCLQVNSEISGMLCGIFDGNQAIQNKLLDDLTRIAADTEESQEDLRVILTHLEDKEHCMRIFEDSMTAFNRKLDDISNRVRGVTQLEQIEERKNLLESLFEESNSLQPQLDNLHDIYRQISSKQKMDQGSLRSSETKLNNLLKHLQEDLNSTKQQTDKLQLTNSKFNEIQDKIDKSENKVKELIDVNNQMELQRLKSKSTELKRELNSIDDYLSGLIMTDAVYAVSNASSEHARDMQQQVHYLCQLLDENLQQKQLDADRVNLFWRHTYAVNSDLDHLTNELVGLSRSSLIPCQRDLERLQNIEQELQSKSKKLDHIRTDLSNNPALSRSNACRMELQKFDKQISELSRNCQEIQIDLHNKIQIAERIKQGQLEFQSLYESAELSNQKLSRDPSNQQLIDTLESLTNQMKDMHQRINAIAADQSVCSDESVFRINKIHSYEESVAKARKHSNHQKELANHLQQKWKQLDMDLGHVESQLDSSMRRCNDLADVDSCRDLLNGLAQQLKQIELELRHNIAQEMGQDEIDGQIIARNDLEIQLRRCKTLEDKIEARQIELQRAQNHLKEHKQNLNNARGLLKQYQSKYSVISSAKLSPYQLECELEKILSLEESMERNDPLVGHNLEIDSNILRCISDDSLTETFRDIEYLRRSFTDLQEHLKKDKANIQLKYHELNKIINEEEELSMWLRKQEKYLQLVDQVSDEEAAMEELERVKALHDMIKSKEPFVEKVSQKSPVKGSRVNHNNLSEKYYDVCKLIDEKEEKLTELLHELQRFSSMSQEWSDWFHQNKHIKKDIRKNTSMDNLERSRALLDVKDSKYEQVLELTTKADCILPNLTVPGRENLKLTVQLARDQWHNLFDNLSGVLEHAEIKQRKYENSNKDLNQLRQNLESIQKSLWEELNISDPVQINFKMGLEDKERQLHKLECLEQNWKDLKVPVNKLESCLENFEAVEDQRTLRQTLQMFVDFGKQIAECIYQSTRSKEAQELFEIALLEAEDVLKMLRKRLILCKDLDGNASSLERRIEALQKAMSKELVLDEGRYDKIFDNAAKSFEKTIAYSSPSEVKQNQNNLDIMYAERQKIFQEMQELRSHFDLSHQNLTEFKSRIDDITKNLGKLNDTVLPTDKISTASVKSHLELIKELESQAKDTENLAVKIVEHSKNNFPLHSAHSIINQINQTKKKLEEQKIELNNFEDLHNEFVEKKMLFEDLISSLTNDLEKTNEIWMEATYEDDLKQCTKEFDKIIKTQNNLEKIYEELSYISSKANKGISQELSVTMIQLKSKMDKCTSNMTNDKQKFNKFAENIDQISQCLADLTKQIKSIDNFDDLLIPNEKLNKQNKIQDLNELKSIVNRIKSDVSEIVLPTNINNMLLDKIELDKNQIIKTSNNYINLIDEQNNNLSKALKRQDELDCEIKSFKENLDYLEEIKFKNTLLDLNGNYDLEKLDEKVKSIDQGISLANNNRRNIDILIKQNAVTNNGCNYQLDVLEKEKSEFLALEKDLKLVKDKINRKRQENSKITEALCDIQRTSSYLDDELHSLKDYGTTMENKRALIDKCVNLKEQILSNDQEIARLALDVSTLNLKEFTSNLELLESKNHSQKDSVDILTENHQQSLKNEELFECDYQALARKLSELKNVIQHKELNNELDDLPNCLEVKSDMEKLQRKNMACEILSSQEGKNLLSRKMSHLSKSLQQMENSLVKLNWKKEKEAMKKLEFDKQVSKLKCLLDEIADDFHNIVREPVKDLIERQSKFERCKQLDQGLKEWYNEFNDISEIAKRSRVVNVNDGSLTLIHNNYKQLNTEIGDYVKDMKVGYNMHQEFCDKMDELNRRIGVLEGDVDDLNNKMDCDNLDQINELLKVINKLNKEWRDSEYSMKALESNLSTLFDGLSMEGQRSLKQDISEEGNKISRINKTLESGKRKLEEEQSRLIEFDGDFRDYELWLGNMESGVVGKNLLGNLEEKQEKLGRIQSIFVEINDKKACLNELVSRGKLWPINLIISHSLRGLQNRFSNLYSNSQSQMDLHAKWVGNHEFYDRLKDKFIGEISRMNLEMGKLSDAIVKKIFTKNVLENVEDLGRRIDKLEESKVELDGYYKLVIGESNDMGRDVLTTSYMDMIGSLNRLKMEFGNKNDEVMDKFNRKDFLLKTLNILGEWHEKFKKKLDFEKNYFDDDMKGIKRNFDNVRDESNENKEKSEQLEGLVEDLELLGDVDMKGNCNKLMEEMKDNESKLKHREENLGEFLKWWNDFEILKEDMDNWIGQNKDLMHNFNQVKGDEHRLDKRIEDLKEVVREGSYNGKQLVDKILEVGRKLLRIWNNKVGKDELVRIIDDFEKQYLDVVKAYEIAQVRLGEVKHQWNEYREFCDGFDRFLKSVGKKKRKLGEIMLDHNSVNGFNEVIEQYQDLLNSIDDRKGDLNEFSKQIHKLKECSGESQIDFVSCDYQDQILNYQMDIKFQLDRIKHVQSELKDYQMRNEIFIDWMESMSAEIMKFDQAQNISCFPDFQQLLQEFDVMRSRNIEGERMLNECQKMSDRIVYLNVSNEQYAVSSGQMQALNVSGMQSECIKQWSEYLDRCKQLEARFNKLNEAWLQFDKLIGEIQDWMTQITSELTNYQQEGFVNQQKTQETLGRLKNIKLTSEIIRQKLTKSTELHYRAETYSMFGDTRDSFQLQKQFIELMEVLGEVDRNLRSTQKSMNRFQIDSKELEKWLLDLSLQLVSQHKSVDLDNSQQSIIDKIANCKKLQLQIESMYQQRLNDHLEKIVLEEIVPNIPARGAVDANITRKLKDIKLGFDRALQLNKKIKQLLKQRLDKVRSQQEILESIEQLLYQDLEEWWTVDNHQLNISRSPEECSDQINEVKAYIDQLKLMDGDFDQLIAENNRQKKLFQKIKEDEDEDNVDEIQDDGMQNAMIDRHLDQVRTDLRNMADKMTLKLNDLHNQSSNWANINEELNLFSDWMDKCRADIESIMLVDSKTDKQLYDNFERLTIEMISKRQALDRINQSILELSGGSQRSHPGSYTKYASICSRYAQLLDRLEHIRTNLRSMNAQDLLDELVRPYSPAISQDFGQSVSKLDLISPYNRSTQTSSQSRGLPPAIGSSHNSLADLVDQSDNVRRPLTNGRSLSPKKLTNQTTVASAVQTTNKKRHNRDKSQLTDLEQEELIREKARRKEERNNRLRGLLNTIQDIRQDFVEHQEHPNSSDIMISPVRSKSPSKQKKEAPTIIPQQASPGKTIKRQILRNQPTGSSSPQTSPNRLRHSTDSVRLNYSPKKSSTKYKKSAGASTRRPTPTGRSTASPSIIFSETPRKSPSHRRMNQSPNKI